MSDTIFKTQNLKKQFKKFKVSTFNTVTYTPLNGLNMEIHQGSIYGFVGKNGAGKTTLMRVMAGLVIPDSGTVELLGKTTSYELCRQRAFINGIIDSPALYPHLTAREHLTICCIQKGIADRSCIDLALKIVNLEGKDTEAKKVRDFSLGMKQRLAIAMALLGRPKLLFFDEPLNGIDPEGIADFRKLIKRLNQKFGITILISSHILKELDQLASCYGFISNGKMLEQISSEDLKEKFNRFLEIKTDDAEKTEKILRTEFKIDKLEVLEENTIKIYEKINKSKNIMRTLINHDIGIEEMKEEGEDLENYYISLINKTS